MMSAASRRAGLARLPFFYGWVVVGVACLTITLGFGTWYSFSVFFVAILEEFGWARGTTAGIYGVGTIVAAFTSPVAGRLLDQVGPRRLFPLGATIMAAGLVAASQASSLPALYLAYGGLTAFGLSLVGVAPHTALIARWFARRRGTAMGLACTGLGLGLMIIAPVAQALITWLGWRGAMAVLAGMVLGGIGPFTLLLQRARPEDLGLEPDGGGGSETLGSRRQRQVRVLDPTWAAREWRVPAAMRTERFWLVFTAAFTGGYAIHGTFIHQMAYMVDLGYQKALAAALLGYVGGVRVLGQVLGGTVSDRIGRERAWTLAAAGMVSGIFCLILGGQLGGVGFFYLYVLLFGLGSGIFSPLPSLTSADLFQGPWFGSIYGLHSMAYFLSMAAGPWLNGLIFDMVQTYRPAFALAMLSAAGSVVLVWLAAPRKVRAVG